MAITASLNALIEQADDPQAVYDELLRREFGLFMRKAFGAISGGSDLQWNWHLDAIAYQLSRVENGNIRRLLVTLPPRNLKSIVISVMWVAWMLGKDPSLSFVCVSYSAELGGKLARQCRTIMEQLWYKRIFQKTIISQKRSATNDFETSAGGGRLTTSVTGTLTGRGGDIIIIDDPIKPEEAQSETTRNNVNDWYRTTLASRLNDKKTGAIICVMQRLHAFDLAGLIMEDGDWEQLSLPAIATDEVVVSLPHDRFHRRREGEVLHPAREPLPVLRQIEREQGSIIFSAQYQQDPVPPGGNMVERQWFQYYEPPFDVTGPGRVVQSWDTASKDGLHNDWSVCVTAHVSGRNVHVVHVFRRKLKFPDLKHHVIRLAREYDANVLLIEDAASGTQLYQTLWNEEPQGVPSPIKQKPESDKETRFAAVTAIIEAGRMYLPKDASWLADFEKELLGFPNSRHDDQVDALSQLLNWADRQDRMSDSAGAIPMYFEDGQLVSGGEYGEDEIDSDDLDLDEGDSCY